MRTWADTDPKARLMARKRGAILSAAREAFLSEGYAGSSVNRIAESADVSIATLYRHFDGKDDLFIAVIEDACATPHAPGATPDWVHMPPPEGLEHAGRELLAGALSEPRLALFRVMAKEAPRFPELARRYHEVIVEAQISLFVEHLAGWPADLRRKVTDPASAARVFAGLVQAGIFDQALFGGTIPDQEAQHGRAREAAAQFLTLVKGKSLLRRRLSSGSGTGA